LRTEDLKNTIFPRLFALGRIKVTLLLKRILAVCHIPLLTKLNIRQEFTKARQQNSIYTIPDFFFLFLANTEAPLFKYPMSLQTGLSMVLPIPFY
jgi:hypothetical protein